MTKRFSLTLLALIPGLFLIVLGMRNPALEHGHGPKQRPRAVVEKVAKSPVVKACTKIPLDALPQAAPATVSRVIKPYVFIASAIPRIASPTRRSRNSRAPPAVTFRRS